jgi:WD40 repeat protein
VILEITLNKAVALGQNMSLTGHTTSINALAFSSDSSYLASVGLDGYVYFWNATENFFLMNKILSPYPPNALYCYALASLPNAQLASSCSSLPVDTSSEISIWSSSGNVIRRLSGHSSNVRCLAVSPDTSLLASGSYDSTVKLWKYASQTTALLTLEGHSGIVASLVFVSDKVLASGSFDFSIKVWNVNTGIRKNKFHIYIKTYKRVFSTNSK